MDNKFVIFTKEYGKELTDCLYNMEAVEVTDDGSGYYFTLSKPDFNLRELVAAMENMILTKNSALTCSGSLRQRIKEMVFADKREALIKDLGCFMRENEAMNWEGYLQFRFVGFANKINLILYSVVKKSMMCFVWI